MNIDKAFPSKYLKAADVEDGDTILTIKDVSVEELEGDPKPIVYFAEREQGLVLNKTNGNTIKDLYGRETTEWVGKQVILYATMVDFQGKSTPAIRVRPTAPKAVMPLDVAENILTPGGNKIGGLTDEQLSQLISSRSQTVTADMREAAKAILSTREPVF